MASKLCFSEAGSHFNIDPLLLRSIAIVESNLNNKAIGINRNTEGKVVSRDYGIMQVNQIHVPSLISKGIIKHEKDLMDDPCLNIKVGSAILHEHFKKCGMNWHCLGTYNAGFAKGNHNRRLIYAKKIYAIYDQLNKLDTTRNNPASDKQPGSRNPNKII
ncbi:lytic transglycosylase domain-containing protein [Yersinia enterocolitica]|uniref:lytic transglycosylase domain-containing protein n=1 Tax=Yersinia enterocolitica TaxID=630 RepID=UPI00398CB290